MQWESGTRLNLLHAVRESKAKRRTSSGVLSRVHDRLDGFIEPAFFERSPESGDKHRSDLPIKLRKYQEAAHDNVQDAFAY